MNALFKTVRTVTMVGFLAVVAMPVWAGLCCHKVAPNVSLLFAASPNTSASEGEKYGKFTEQFLSYMSQPNLTWPQLVDKVKQAVKQSTDDKQVAYLEGDVLPNFVLSASSNQNKTALIIGNNGSKDFPLTNPVHDANAITAQFKKLGYDTLTITDATHDVMQASVEVFQHKLKSGGVGVVYYSGHGVQMDGENYLVPVDAELESRNEMKMTLINISSVLNTLKSTKASILLFIIDASRDNPFLLSR